MQGADDDGAVWIAVEEADRDLDARFEGEVHAVVGAGRWVHQPGGARGLAIDAGGGHAPVTDGLARTAARRRCMVGYVVDVWGCAAATPSCIPVVFRVACARTYSAPAPVDARLDLCRAHAACC